MDARVRHGPPSKVGVLHRVHRPTGSPTARTLSPGPGPRCAHLKPGHEEQPQHYRLQQHTGRYRHFLIINSLQSIIESIDRLAIVNRCGQMHDHKTCNIKHPCKKCGTMGHPGFYCKKSARNQGVVAMVQNSVLPSFFTDAAQGSPTPRAQV